MLYLKKFDSFSVNENSQTVILSDEEKRCIEELKLIDDVNLIQYYKNNNGFNLQCMPFDTKKNSNEVNIECEKEADGKIYLHYSQESDYSVAPEDDGFNTFPAKVHTIEKAVQEIKKLLEISYK